MTTDEVLAQIANLPDTEIGKVADFCTTLLAKNTNREPNVKRVEQLIETLEKLDFPHDVRDDVRLEFLLEKHGNKA